MQHYYVSDVSLERMFRLGPWRLRSAGTPANGQVIITENASIYCTV